MGIEFPDLVHAEGRAKSQKKIISKVKQQQEIVNQQII